MLTIKTEKAAFVTIFELEGDVDAASFETLIQEAQAHIEQGATHILLDMVGVGYLSSVGLFALQSIVRMLHGDEPLDPDEGWAAQGTFDADLSPALKLCNVANHILVSLERTGFTTYVGVYEDRDAALAAFS